MDAPDGHEEKSPSHASREEWMNEAIRLGRAGMHENGGGPFGALVVCDERVVGRGFNQVTRRFDPTAHAEILAIREACQSLKRFELRGCDLYTSCEPCPMCLSAIYWSRIAKVYYAGTRTDAASAGFDDEFIYGQIPLKLSARSLPMEQLSPSAASELFQEWSAKPARVTY